MRISDWSSDVCSSDLRCMEHTDVERVRLGRRVGQYKVFGDRRRRKALAMDGDGKFGKAMSLRAPRSEQPDVRPPGARARDDGGRVMIAGPQERWNHALVQAVHRFREVMTGPHAPPVALCQVPAYDHELNDLVVRPLHQVYQSHTRHSLTH